MFIKILVLEGSEGAGAFNPSNSPEKNGKIQENAGPKYGNAIPPIKMQWFYFL